MKMKTRFRRDVCTLFLLSLAVRLAVALLIDRPGYVDTAYYAAGAVRLAEGGGLAEPFVWNYLDSPEALPHAAFFYWMPLPSLLAAPFAVLWPGSFFALQLPFVLASAILPTIAFWLGWRLGGQRRTAWAAGMLTLFSGFFFPYWTIPETFSPFALFGSLALCAAALREQTAGYASRWAGIAVSVASGAFVGLAHLTRPDGPLLLIVVLGGTLLGSRQRNNRGGRLRSPAGEAILVSLGYLLVMAPWFARNLAVAGTLLPTAGTKTLWLRTYDDIFCFRCDVSAGSYLSWGWGNIVESKLVALGINLQRFVAEDCLVFLLLFVIVGLVRLRRNLVYSQASAYLVLALLFHSLGFTFPGQRGGFFHASAAALPMVFAAAAAGLDVAIQWVGARRRWRIRQARIVFAAAAISGAVALSAYAARARLGAWRTADAVFEEVERCIAGHEEASAVMVNNPPAFWYQTGRGAVAVPNGGIDMLMAAAEVYGVSHVVLDENRPLPLAALYSGAESDSRLERVCECGSTVVYRVR